MFPRARAVVVCARWCVWCGCVRALVRVVWLCAPCGCACSGRVGVCGYAGAPHPSVLLAGRGVGGVLFLCGCVVAVSYSPTTCRSQYHWRYRA